MNTIRLFDGDDEPIIVTRSAKGRIVVSHCDCEEAGEFIEPGFSFRGEPRLGGLKIGVERYPLSHEETCLVRRAIQQLQENELE